MLTETPICIAGCGYIGKQLAAQLLSKQIPVSAIVHSVSSQAECLQKNIPCERIDLDAPLQSIDLSGQHLIYLAPPPHSGRTDTRLRNFLAAIEEKAPDRFVLISTTGVYGDCAGDWIDETTPLNPTADRAHRRADAEQAAQQYCQRKHIPLVILRVAGIYGPGKIPLERIKSGQAIVRQEDSPFTNRIHAHDLVNICETALRKPNITGIYNVTDGHPSTMYEYFNGVASALKLEKPPAISLEQAQQQLSDGMLSYMAESRRIKNEKLLKDFVLSLHYPTLAQGLKKIT